MGLLVDGKWQKDSALIDEKEGRFIRKESQFRNWITSDGSAGPTGEGGFKAEPNRYHLYVSYACPWANRTLIMRQLKGLEELISVSVVNPYRDENGWTFAPGPEVDTDPVLNADYLHQIYTHVEPDYSGRVTVPILYDLKQDKIVNNESSEIMRMLNSVFDEVGADQGDYYPAELSDKIDALNDEIYDKINNGVYKTGFSTKQAVYDEEVTKLFEALDQLDKRLEDKRFLLGDQLTEADWRLFVTLIRFDSVYHGHFKCNLKRIVDYKNLWRYTRELYNYRGVAETINFDHIKEHYYATHKNINPTGIVPKGPELDFSLA